MNNLKKALTKQDPKKYQKSKIQISCFKKSNKWGEAQWMVQKKIEKKNSSNNLEDQFRTIIQGQFINGEMKDVNKLFKDLKDRYRQVNKDSSASSNSSKGILEVLHKMHENETGSIMKKYIASTIERVQELVKEKKKIDKQKQLSDFNKIMNILKPNKLQKQQKIEQTSKLAYSTSASNLKIKLTKEEYQFEEETFMKKKKSLDFKSKSKANSSMEGANKLQMFFKESNLKLVKTKIQYDYSAIFEASKSNIQSRNKTTIEQKNQKEVISKANKGKKNDAFVFYRPSSKKI